MHFPSHAETSHGGKCNFFSGFYNDADGVTYPRIKIRLDIIRASESKLYRAYCLKESLRLLLKSMDVNQAEAGLKHWATNNKIKPVIRKAYGFRNIQNMMDMVYPVCSKIRIPLTNRKPKLAEEA